jgi:hypothetical protein
MDSGTSWAECLKNCGCEHSEGTSIIFGSAVRYSRFKAPKLNISS